MAQTFGRRRQIDRYDGQTIFIGSQVAYELGNYLGGGASGSVYQALDVTSYNPQEKSVAIKILKPLGYKILPYGQLAKCLVASKGQPLNQKQIHGKAPLNAENLWWLVHPSSEHVYAAYEDASRGQLRELTLPRCIEIWGWAPLGSDQLSPEVIEKKNLSGQSFVVSNSSIVQLPIVAPKYLKWLQSRATICREMNNMIHIGEHPNIVDLLEVLELIQDSKAVLFLVLEFVNGGELFDRMKRSSGPGTPSDEFARRYFSQLLSGIDYCHCKGVVHRDLKPENLLLSDPSESAILKIADFGLSAVVFATEGGDATFFPPASGVPSSPNYFPSPSGGNDRDRDQNFLSVTGMPSEGQHVHFNQAQSPIQILHSPVATHKQQQQGQGQGQGQQGFLTPTNSPSPVPLRRLRSVVGSPHYIAPEIVNHAEDPCGYDGRKVDMWSAGVILYSLLTGSLPFGGDLSSCPRYKLYRQWMLSEYGPALREGRSRDVPLPVWFFPPSISPLAGSLILQLIHVDPQLRCTAAEALRHPWSAGEGVKPASSDSQRNQKGVKLFPPEETLQAGEREREREREKVKANKGAKEQKERRMSAPPSPIITFSAAAASPLSARAGKPPRSPPSTSTCIPAVQPHSRNSGSPGSNSPTLASLTSAASALAHFSVDAVQEIVITEELQLTLPQREQQSEEREEAVAPPRLDSVPIVVESSLSAYQTINRTRMHSIQSQPLPSSISSETPTAATTSIPVGPPKFNCRPVYPPAAIAASESVRSREVQSNQSQQSVIAPRYPTRTEQTRGGTGAGGQDSEEEGRKERYQSILEQQRQKEAAALAMDQAPADQPPHQPHSHSHPHTVSAASTANPNREPGSADNLAILLPARESSRTINPNSMFVHNENENCATTEAREVLLPNQRIHISAESENIVTGNYIVGENNSSHCDQPK